MNQSIRSKNSLNSYNKNSKNSKKNSGEEKKRRINKQ